MIAEVSHRDEYRPTAESLQAMTDLTITARVKAMFMAPSGLEVLDLEVKTRCGEVHVGGIILAEGVKYLAADAIRKIPGVTRVTTDFVITPPEHYPYADAR
jgi:osmotically-inducible protein OsmY